MAHCTLCGASSASAPNSEKTLGQMATPLSLCVLCEPQCVLCSDGQGGWAEEEGRRLHLPTLPLKVCPGAERAAVGSVIGTLVLRTP